MRAAIVLGLAVLAACSHGEPPPQAVATTHGAPAAPAEVKACTLVSEAEMTAILGGAVIAKADDGESNGQTSCTYSPASGISPYAELKVEWGMADAAMMAGRMAASIEPGLASPYAGLGDQAITAGPAIMIRRGEDLLTIVLSGVDDVPEAAKKIYETAAARM
jgi:hypothetical protein